MSALDQKMLMEATGMGYTMGQQPKYANLHDGATLGAGIKSVSLDAATPLLLPPVTIVVLQTPTIYDNSPAFARMLKTIMETHATSVTGIELQYSVETATSVVGHDGQTIKVPTQVKRTEVNPTFTFPEVTGNLIWEVFNRWAFDLGDPDTNAFAASQATPNTFVSSAYSLSMAAIQFDASMLPQNIIGGAFYSNMFPTDPAGGFGLERTIGTSKTPERSVAFTGHIRHNWQTRQLLVQLATDLGLGRMRYTGGQAQAAPFADIMKGAGITNELDLLLKA